LSGANLSLTPEQQLVLQAIYDQFRERGTWPTFISIDRPLRRTHNLDTQAILQGLPGSLIVKTWPGIWFNADDEVLRHLELPLDDLVAPERLYAMLQLGHWGPGGGGSDPDGWWFVTVTPDIWRFRDVHTAEDCVKARREWRQEAEAANLGMRSAIPAGGTQTPEERSSRAGELGGLVGLGLVSGLGVCSSAEWALVERHMPVVTVFGVAVRCLSW
jgi:hypothetical protein